MSERELPEGWQEVSLEEVAAPTPASIKIGPFGSSLRKTELLSSGPYKVYGQENILSGDFTTGTRFIDSVKWTELRSCELRAGDVCITMMGSLGGSCIVPDNICPGIMDSHLLRIRPNLKVVDPKFLVVFLRGSPPMNRQLEESAHGSIMQGLNASIVRSLRLPVPPLAEQKRIVAKVEELLARVNGARERLDRAPKIMKRFRQSVLAAACSGRLTDDWRGEYTDVEPAPVTVERMRDSRPVGTWYEPDFEHRETSELPPLWAFVALGSLGDWFSGGTPSTSVPRFWKDGTVPWVTPKDMKAPVILDSQDHITEEAVSRTRLHVLQPGTLMFVVRGLILARSFPVALAGKATTINQDMRAIATDRGMSANYLLYALRAEEAEILHAVRDSTHGTKRLESQTLKTWPIPVPPIAEQEETVRRVKALFKLADAIDKRVAAAKVRTDRMTQSILAKAFRGELVPTEAELARQESRSYEPASALLESIVAEREKGKQQTKKRQRDGSTPTRTPRR